MSGTKFSKEEKELLEAIEAGEFESVLTESRKKELEAVASNTFRKDKKINIRISSRDCQQLDIFVTPNLLICFSND